MSYANGISALYQFPAIDLATTSEMWIKGPSGAEGRLIGVSSVITVTTTTANVVVTVGTQADPDAYCAVHTIPFDVAEVSQNGFTRGADERIPADTLISVIQDGGADAGDGDLFILIEWYGGNAS